MENFNPKYSIIFPSYNGEIFLTQLLDSIKKLSNLNEVELIIIDNNSSDSSISVIESYNKEIIIKLIKKNQNIGFAKACNLGALEAKGEFIFITNQDMLIPSDFFVKVIEIYKSYKKDSEISISPAIVFKNKNIHYFGAKNHFLGFSYTPDMGEILPKEKIIKSTNRLSGGALFIKKSVFLENHGFDNEFFMYYEDTDFSLRVLRKDLKLYTTNDPYLIHLKEDLILNDFQYYLLERNRFFTIIKNINGFKKILPVFLINEVILLFHSIISKKFKLRIRIYVELMTKIKTLRKLRDISKKEADLLPYYKLSRKLDPLLLGNLKSVKIFVIFLNLFNFLLKQV